MTETRRGAVLVTGAAKGIGAATVAHLEARGWHVLAGVRSERDELALRREGVTPIRLDVTDADSIAAAATAVAAETGEAGLAGLVNNAGIAMAGPLEFLPVDAIRHQLEVNVIGQIATTQALLPLLRRGPGRIIFVSSIAGRSALPLVGAYAASKFALEATADALRVELSPWRLPVVLIEPGVIETPIWDTAMAAAKRSIDRMPAAALEYYGPLLEGLERRMAGGVRGLPPEAVARAIERALGARRPAARYVVGRGARARLLLEALPARWRDAVVSAGMKRMIRGEPTGQGPGAGAAAGEPDL